MNHQYDLRIAGVRMRILSPREIRFLENYDPFLTNHCEPPDFVVEVFFDTKDISKVDGKIYRITQCADGEDILRIEPEKPFQPWRIGIPNHMAEDVCNHGNWLLYLPLERILLPFQRVILHASAVIYQGRAFVFTAPSGTGKSTHADIWAREYGAEILNGDKVILSLEGREVVAHGSPVAGSSGIYKNLSAPVAAIIQLKQGSRNSIVGANDRNGYFALYSGLVKNQQDPAFNQKLLPLIEGIVQSVPMATLHCRPDRDAVRCMLQWMNMND